MNLREKSVALAKSTDQQHLVTRSPLKISSANVSILQS